MMKLHTSPFSPYARKVLAAAIELGLEDQIELITTQPREAKDFAKLNPLMRIPALVEENGSVLFDSPVICEYLDHRAGGHRLFPVAGADRWQALKLQALGDGLMDAAVPRRQEMVKPEGERSLSDMERYRKMVVQGLDLLETMTASLGPLSIGSLSVACALGYLDLRFADEPWRGARPRLAQWFAQMEARPSLVRSKPAV